MKLQSFLAFGLVATTPLFCDVGPTALKYHEQSVTLSTDFLKDPIFKLSVQHQSTFVNVDGHSVLFHLYSHANDYHAFHHELGMGYRMHFDDVTFGLNFVPQLSNEHGKYLAQVSPGFELFWKDWRFTFNRYIPVELTAHGRDFSDISEATLQCSVTKTLDVSLTSHYDHQREKFGVSFTVGRQYGKMWRFDVTPYLHSDGTKGGIFAMTYDFGGSKSRHNAPIQKTHRFFSSAAATPSSAETSPFQPSVEPMVIKHDDGTESVVFIPVPAPAPEKEPEPSPWYKRLFF
jgi:hypothetical protein